jgi:hypothetical protein
MFRPGFLGLTAQLHCLLESGEGEHNAAKTQRGQDSLHPERGESAVLDEVRTVEMDHDDRDDHEQNGADLPPRQDVVDPADQSNSKQVQ